jgi:hypothetical protein
MPETGIPADVEQFIADEIRSVEQLEVLLRLHREPTAWRTAESLAGELRTSNASVAARLKEMQARGLLEGNADLGYRYLPARPEIERAVRQLDRLYAERRVTIITLIFSKPMDPVRDFSDAFRIRKGQDT